MLTDIDHIHPPAYVHWHKCWVWPTGFTEGPNEVRMLMGKLDGIIIGESTNKKVKSIFKEKPSMSFDNCFSHENISDLAGKKGYVLIYTVSHDCLPKGVPT
eukprot:6507477-Ditylum_brightwellii.AAC.1